MAIAFVGIDLAKNVFQIHGTDGEGKLILSRRLQRDQLLAEVAKLPPLTIGIEACTGAFYWQREFQKLGHQVRIIAPRYVKPFVKHQKNDRNNAEAICTAMRQPNMKFVPQKNEEQQDIQALHRARARLINHRTALVSQMRGLLLDRGISIGVSIARARKAIPQCLADSTNGLSAMSREVIAELFDFLGQIDLRVQSFDQRIEAIFRSNAAGQRIARICGVGQKPRQRSWPQ